MAAFICVGVYGGVRGLKSPGHCTRRLHHKNNLDIQTGLNHQELRDQRLGVLFLSSHFQWTDFTFKTFTEMVFGHVKIILVLQPQPELGGVAKEARQT